MSINLKRVALSPVCWAVVTVLAAIIVLLMRAGIIANPNYMQAYKPHFVCHTYLPLHSSGEDDLALQRMEYVTRYRGKLPSLQIEPDPSYKNAVGMMCDVVGEGTYADLSPRRFTKVGLGIARMRYQMGQVDAADSYINQHVIDGVTGFLSDAPLKRQAILIKARYMVKHSAHYKQSMKQQVASLLGDTAFAKNAEAHFLRARLMSDSKSAGANAEYQQAYQLGYKQAAYYLALQEQPGSAQYLQYLKQAVNAGSPAAMLLLAKYYEANAKPKAAQKLLKQAINKNYYPAMAYQLSQHDDVNA